MKTGFAAILFACCLTVVFSGCKKKCHPVVQPALYFALVDQANKPVLTDNNLHRVTILYKGLGRPIKDTLRLSDTLGAANSKYQSTPLLVSREILAKSTWVDSASYEFYLDKKPVGTLRLYPFQRSVDCDTWTYTSSVTFNGKVISPVGPTNEVYLLPVTH